MRKIPRPSLKLTQSVKIGSLAVLLSVSANARAFCFAEAATRYTVNEWILRAIASHESRMNPNLQLVNTNNSVDIGLMGINTVHVSPGERLHAAGFTAQTLLDPCTNVMTGAYLLRLKMNRFGNTWHAVGAYHSVTDKFNLQYQQKIWNALQRLLNADKKPAVNANRESFSLAE